MNYRRALSLFFLATFVFFMTACSDKGSGIQNVNLTNYDSNDVTDIKHIVVGFSQMENNMPFRIAETESMMREARIRGVGLIYKNAQSDIEQQIDDIRFLIDQNVDYLVVVPRHQTGFAEVLKEAKEAGITVILEARDTEGERLTCIHSNHYWGGQQAAVLMSEALGDQGKVLEILGTIGAEDAVQREKGFDEYLTTEFPNINILDKASGDYRRNNSKEIMTDFLKKYGDIINGVFCHNDEMAMGVLEAIEDDGRFEAGKDIYIVSIDGQRDALKKVVDGEIYGIVECTPLFGPITFNIIEDHLNGGVPDEVYYNYDRIFTKDGRNYTVKAEDAIGTTFD